MIDLGPPPEGALIRRGDVLRWLPGLSLREWEKMQPTFHAVVLPGHSKPYYSRAEVYAKLVRPIEAAIQSHPEPDLTTYQKR